MTTFVCYPKCSTCAKARLWLHGQGISFSERDIKEERPTYEELKTWLGRSGLPVRRFFNTSGLLYRSLGLKDRLDSMDEDEALHLLATDGMLVKRPILLTDEGQVLVGFKPAEWADRYSTHPGK